jgi:hypothetical protein
MCWKLRLQVSAAGVHRPPVGGIAGTEKVRDQCFHIWNFENIHNYKVSSI